MIDSDIMAEYWVTHKRMDEEKTRIIKVKAMLMTNGLLHPEEYSRECVVERIENGNKWYTCKHKEGKTWIKGAEIHVIEIGKEKFIRMDRNNIKSDNLGELPDF